MLVGVPKEIKDNEFRVGMTPAAVVELVHHGMRSLSRLGPASGSGLGRRGICPRRGEDLPTGPRCSRKRR